MKIVFDDQMLNIIWKSNGENKSFLVKNVDDVELDNTTLNQIQILIENTIAEKLSSVISKTNLTDNEITKINELYFS